MCAVYKKNNSRCTCSEYIKEVSIPKHIRDVIDLEPLQEFREDAPYRDNITDAYEYIQRIMRYNFK